MLTPKPTYALLIDRGLVYLILCLVDSTRGLRVDIWHNYIVGTNLFLGSYSNRSQTQRSNVGGKKIVSTHNVGDLLVAQFLLL